MYSEFLDAWHVVLWSLSGDGDKGTSFDIRDAVRQLHGEKQKIAEYIRHQLGKGKLGEHMKIPSASPGG